MDPCFIHCRISTQKFRKQNGVLLVRVVGEMLLMLLQMFYYNLESIYRFFALPKEKAVKGEIVLVTGAGHGIGKELALQYAALGATVVAWDINEKNNTETVTQINQQGRAKAYGYVCDVANRANVFEVVERVKKDVGDITIIVNNAGIMPTHSLLDQTADEIERTFKVNVFGHFWVLQAILPSMLKNNNGHIVAISSCAGLVGLENLVPYCASKWAVKGYMEALFHEIRTSVPNTRIKFTTVYPYMVDTGLCKKPKMRFEGSMNMESPEVVARKAIEAQRRNLSEITIPEYFFYLVNSFRIMSGKACLKLKDFLGVYLESDL
ncbi:hypothetical protein Trydic_g5780 [Trypoxylus dichotomus]